MGKACKCKICKKTLSTDNAYCVITHDKNGKVKKNFYCSKAEVDAEEARKRKAATDKKRAYKLVCEIIGRDEIINKILWKEWAIWNKVASDEKIASYLEENKEYLVNMISRLDDIEFNRIRYLSAILRNKLGDYKPKVKEVEKAVVKCNSFFELFEPTIIRNNEADNIILEDVEDDLL